MAEEAPHRVGDAQFLDDTVVIDRLHRQLTRQVPHQAEFAVLERFRGERGLFVDVGANIGQSIASLRLYNTAMRAVCFEPLPWLEPALAELLRLDMIDAYHVTALGDSYRPVSLLIPWVSDVPLFTRATQFGARFDDAAYQDTLRRVAKRPGGKIRIQSIRVRCARLDDFILAPTVLKLDVEGNELAVLRGAAGTLEMHRPFVLLEPSRDQEEIAAFMQAYGYQAYRWRDGALTPWDGRPAENIWFEPEKHTGASSIHPPTSE